MHGAWRMLAAAAVLIAACNSTPVRAIETAAVLHNPDAATRTALEGAISEMLQGAKVTLADDALLHDSWITVERARPRAANGQLVNGRILERPERFQLVMERERCVLVQHSNGRRKMLDSVACRAV
jgi:hypothetical protein